jgi:hypothetical protein
MTFPELLDALQRYGVRLELFLDVDLPEDAPAALEAALGEHKPALLVALAREAQWKVLSAERWGPAVDEPTPGIGPPDGGPVPAPGPAPAGPSTPCYWWRTILATWPIDWREAWGWLAEELESKGTPWPDSEINAFNTVAAMAPRGEEPHAPALVGNDQPCRGSDHRQVDLFPASDDAER